jgi:hypothetical protein
LTSSGLEPKWLRAERAPAPDTTLCTEKARSFAFIIQTLMYFTQRVTIGARKMAWILFKGGKKFTSEEWEIKKIKIQQAETAINHFHLVVSDALAPSLIERIRNFIEGHPRKPDWTLGEISFGMELQKSTVSARRNEMLKLNILERGEKRCCSISGVKCETVRLSAMVTKR